MCNIGKDSALETKTVYKVVVEVDGKYFGMFSGAPVKVGPVEKQNWAVDSQMGFIEYAKAMPGYNEKLVGRSTGFEKLDDALSLRQCWKGSKVSKVLELELVKTEEKPIMEGTAGKTSGVQENAAVYAGAYIKSLKIKA